MDWKEKDFDDSAWKAGAAPLGYPASEEHGTFGKIATLIEYGSDSTNKPATSYFRTTFEVDDLSKLNNSGLITAGIDDGAIIYLNGNEIARINLPMGEEIKFDDYVQKFGYRDSDEKSDKIVQLTTEQMDYIVKGINVLAVEVHQVSPSSSDVFFDLEFKSIYADQAVYDASYISFAPGADETKRNFSWYSPKTDVPGVIEYAKVVDGKPETAKTVIATLAVASPGYQANEATITDIKGSSEYVYRLGDGNGKWTKSYSFKTQETESYNFLFTGDPQIGSGNIASDTAGWVDTLDKAINKFPNTSFIQSAGDQVNNENSEVEYTGYFTPEHLKQYPTATTIGNHDNSVYYEYHFNVPNQNSELGNSNNAGGDYYFTYGDTLIMNLNSNNMNAAEHIQFMEETIEATKDQDLKWKIVVFHHSVYSAANHSLSASIIKFREDLVPTIDKLEIDAVLSGHDHSYVRTYQMKNLQPLKNQMVKDGSVINPEGTLYLTANSSSGSKYYTMKDPEFYSAERSQLRVPTFTNIEVTPTSLEFTTYRVDTMKETDTYKIVKDDSIPVEMPRLKEVKLEATTKVIPTEASNFYPELRFTVNGISDSEGPYDIAYENITYKTDKDGQISVASNGEVTIQEGAEPGEVNVWAKVEVEGKTIQTNKVTITVLEHAEKKLIEKRSEWKYLDNGSDQGTAWRELSFDDSTWKTGAAPLGYPVGEDHGDFGDIATVIGYGGDSQNKYATSYFRTTFEIEDLDAIGTIGLITAAIDDGAILYLNGHEIGRYNLPEGEDIPYDGYVEGYGYSDANENDNEIFNLNESHLSHLVEGKNVLAAEVHQDRPTSSDIYWDMEFVTTVNNETEEETDEETITPEKVYDYQDYFTGKLMIHDPSVSVSLDAASNIKNGVVFTGKYAEFHGEGFANTTVEIKPKKDAATVIDFKGTKVKEVIIEGSNVEIRGDENVQVTTYGKKSKKK